MFLFLDGKEEKRPVNGQTAAGPRAKGTVSDGVGNKPPCLAPVGRGWCLYSFLCPVGVPRPVTVGRTTATET